METFIPILSHIVCIDKVFNIGILDRDTNQFSMPWGHTLKGDLKRFKELTQNNIVLMGSNTYKSIGKPLPNRINIVVSSSTSQSDSDNLYIRNTLDEALILSEYLAYRDLKNIFIVGGSTIYKQTSHLISKAYITIIDTDYTNKNYDFITYNFSHLQLFKIQDIQPYAEELISDNVYFTIWERI